MSSEFLKYEEYEKYIEKIRSLITRDISKYCIVIFIVLTIIGLLTLNGYIVIIGSSTLCTLLTTMLIPYPEVNIDVELSSEKCEVGNILDIYVKVVSRRGLGIITIKVEVPEEFDIIDSRTIFSIFKGFQDIDIKYRIRVRPTKIGTYKVKISRVELWNIFSTRGLKIEEPEIFKIVHVVPKMLTGRGRLRVRPRIYRLPPVQISRLKIGPASTEFREIRKYVPGDPIKYINWKATARIGLDYPLVNEYERESISRIFIIPDLSLRTLLEGYEINSHDEIISIVLSLSRILLRNGCQIKIFDPYTSKIFKIYGAQLKLYKVIEHFTRFREYVKIGNDVINNSYIVETILKNCKDVDYIIMITCIDNTIIRKLLNIIKMMRKYRNKIIIVDIDSQKIIEKVDLKYGICTSMYMSIKDMLRSYLSRHGVRVLKYSAGSGIGKIVSEIICQVL